MRFGSDTRTKGVNMPTLYELVSRTNELEQLIAEAGGEISPDMETALAELDISMPAKVYGYSVTMDRLKVAAKYWAEKAEQYSKIAGGINKAAERVKNGLKDAMLMLGKTELAGCDVKFNLSSGAPSLVLTDALPASYLLTITTTVPDKERIKADLRKGIKIPGAKLVPSLTLRSSANKEK